MRERHQNSHRTTTRAIQHAQSHKRVARARAMVSCVRPGVQYLDATPGGQWATTPPLQLRGWARVWSVKHSQRVAQAHVRFSRNMSIENVKNTFYLGFSHFFVGVYKVLRLPWKISPNEPEASEVPHLPQGISIMSKIKNDDTFSTKRDFSILSKRRPSSRNIAPAMQNDFQKRFSLSPVPRRPCEWKSIRCLAPVTLKQRFRSQNAPKVPRPPPKMDIARTTSITAR